MTLKTRILLSLVIPGRITRLTFMREIQKREVPYAVASPSPQSAGTPG
jgi:hypothetical protein